jgi:hypothetical protein
VLKGADEGLGVERVVSRDGARLARGGEGRVGEELDEVFDDEVLALEESAGWVGVRVYGCQCTEKVSRVKVEARLPRAVLDVFWVRIDAVSGLALLMAGKRCRRDHCQQRSRHGMVWWVVGGV